MMTALTNRGAIRPHTGTLRFLGTLYPRPTALLVRYADRGARRERALSAYIQLKNEVETALEEEVTRFDLREAAYPVAQENPKAVAEKLEKMGVGLEL